jgi:hypothetical protein
MVPMILVLTVLFTPILVPMAFTPVQMSVAPKPVHMGNCVMGELYKNLSLKPLAVCSKPRAGALKKPSLMEWTAK